MDGNGFPLNLHGAIDCLPAPELAFWKYAAGNPSPEIFSWKCKSYGEQASMREPEKVKEQGSVHETGTVSVQNPECVPGRDEGVRKGWVFQSVTFGKCCVLWLLDWNPLLFCHPVLVPENTWKQRPFHHVFFSLEIVSPLVFVCILPVLFIFKLKKFCPTLLKYNWLSNYFIRLKQPCLWNFTYYLSRVGTSMCIFRNFHKSFSNWLLNWTCCFFFPYVSTQIIDMHKKKNPYDEIVD